MQLTHLDASLITLFVIVTFCEPILLCVFYSLSNKFACFIMMATYIKQFFLKDFILLNNSTQILVLILFLKDRL